MSLPVNREAPETSIVDGVYEAVEQSPAALSRVALYVAQNPDKVITQSIASLGRNAGSGEATIIRLCKQLGFRGFKDFKLALAQEIEREKTLRDKEYRVDRSKSRNAQLDAISVALQTAVQKSADMIDPAQVEVIADKLTSARRIDVYGAGVSNVCADVIAHRLIWLRIPVHVARTANLARGAAATLMPGDVAIGISYSGVTDETVSFLQIARAQGAFCVAVTTRPDSTLAKAADQVVALSQAGPWPQDGSVRLIPSITVFTEFLADRLQTQADDT